MVEDEGALQAAHDRGTAPPTLMERARPVNTHLYVGHPGVSLCASPIPRRISLSPPLRPRPSVPPMTILLLRPLRAHILFVILAAIGLAACSTPPGPPRIDNLPMYGAPEIPRPTQLKQADERFVRNAAAGFGGDRRLASIAWTDQADHFFADGNFDYAMRRYNEAWLLDETNYEVFLGFSRVMAHSGDIDAAIAHLQKAIDLCTVADQRPLLIAELNQLKAHPSK